MIDCGFYLSLYTSVSLFVFLHCWRINVFINNVSHFFTKISRICWWIFSVRRYDSYVVGVYLSNRPSVHLSVRPFVTRRHCTKTAKHWITQKAIYDSPGTLVFGRQKSRRNSNEVTQYAHGNCMYWTLQLWRSYEAMKSLLNRIVQYYFLFLSVQKCKHPPTNMGAIVKIKWHVLWTTVYLVLPWTPIFIGRRST